MKNLKIAFLLVLMLCVSKVIAQQTPASKQSKDIAIVGATAHIGNGNVIDKSLIIIKEGKLHTVADLAVAKIDLTGMEVISANEKHVYPGFIVPNSTF